MAPRDAYALILRMCGYVSQMAKGTLPMGLRILRDDPRLSRWILCNHKGLYKTENSVTWEEEDK